MHAGIAIYVIIMNVKEKLMVGKASEYIIGEIEWKHNPLHSKAYKSNSITCSGINIDPCMCIAIIISTLRLINSQRCMWNA